jgi:DNA-binding GntR family transcriptional regulator
MKAIQAAVTRGDAEEAERLVETHIRSAWHALS